MKLSFFHNKPATKRLGIIRYRNVTTVYLGPLFILVHPHRPLTPHNMTTIELIDTTGNTEKSVAIIAVDGIRIVSGIMQITIKEKGARVYFLGTLAEHEIECERNSHTKDTIDLDPTATDFDIVIS